MPDYNGIPSRAVLARLSRNRTLIAMAEAMEQLAHDPTVRLVGLVEVHDGACPFPLAACDPVVCVPIYLPRPPSRHGRPH